MAKLREIDSLASRSASADVATVVQAINMRQRFTEVRPAQAEFLLDEPLRRLSPSRFSPSTFQAMRDDYIKDALKSINDPNVLINVVSRRVKQLKRGNRPLVESLEKLSPEDIALREVIEGKISFESGS